MLVGLAAHRFAFLGGAIFAFVSFICLVVGLAIYTIVFSRVIKAVNDYKINNVALGLDFAYGNGLVRLLLHHLADFAHGARR